MIYLALRNWDKFQHYRDRSPPWIKLYNSILEDYNFTKLSDETKWHVVAIMLLASRSGNKIPADPAWIKLRISAQKLTSLDEVLKSGMFEQIQEDNQPLANGYHDASKMLDQSRAETEQRQSKSASKMLAEDDPDFLAFWNEVPKKEDKLDCRKELYKALKNTSIETIVWGAKRWAKEKAQTERRYIASPAKWLRAQKWEDEAGTTTRNPNTDWVRN